MLRRCMWDCAVRSSAFGFHGNVWKCYYSQTRMDGKGFMESLFCKLEYTCDDDWYKLTRQAVEKNGGSYLFKDLGCSNILELLRTVYPDKTWNIFQFKRLPKSFWVEKENRQLYLEQLGKELGIKEMKDWLNVKYKDMYEHGGSAILLQFGNVKNILLEHYPDCPWEEWASETNIDDTFLSTKKPQGYWENIDNQRKLFDEIGKKFNITSMNDWNTISRKSITSVKGGSSVLNKYSSIQEALETLYPEFEWNVLDRKKVSRNFWIDKNNHRVILDKIIKDLNLSSPKDLLSLSKQDIKKAGCKSLYSHYPNLYCALKENYPEYKWNIFDFKPLPRNIWQDKNIQKEFLLYFAEKENIKTFEDWKLVNCRTFHNAGGSSILNQYPSFIDMLSELLPEYTFDVLKDRNVVPRKYWDSPENIQKFLEEFKKEYYITELKDWERVSASQIISFGGGGLIQKFKNLKTILYTAYPKENWKPINLKSKRKRATQRFVFHQIQVLCKEREIIEEYIHEELSRDSGIHVEFDVYIPSLKVGIEYHGEQHYKDIPAFGPLEQYKERDKEKEKLCKENNIHLVVIPYWTSTNLKSIQKILFEQLPENMHKYFSTPNYNIKE